MAMRGAGSRKWVLTAALLVSLGAAWWALREDPPQPTAVTAPPTQQPSRPPPPPERDDFDPPPLPPSPTPELAVAPPPQNPIAISTPRPPKHPIDPEAFARQTALLERALEEVKSEPERALKTLVEFEQQFPLSDDAELVHLEAFLRLGRREEAETLGRKLIAQDAALKKPVEQLLSRVRPR